MFTVGAWLDVLSAIISMFTTGTIIFALYFKGILLSADTLEIYNCN